MGAFAKLHACKHSYNVALAGVKVLGDNSPTDKVERGLYAPRVLGMPT